MNTDPLLPEDFLRAHLQRPPSTAPDAARLAAICVQARRSFHRRHRRRLLLAASVALAFTGAGAWLGTHLLRSLGPSLTPVTEALQSCGRVAWELSQNSPALLADTGRQLLSQPLVPWFLVAILAAELAALSLLNFNRSPRHV
jgi:hypothetical protein